MSFCDVFFVGIAEQAKMQIRPLTHWHSQSSMCIRGVGFSRERTIEVTRASDIAFIRSGRRYYCVGIDIGFESEFDPARPVALSLAFDHAR
jgi:hypothetical protein